MMNKTLKKGMARLMATMLIIGATVGVMPQDAKVAEAAAATSVTIATDSSNSVVLNETNKYYVNGSDGSIGYVTSNTVSGGESITPNATFDTSTPVPTLTLNGFSLTANGVNALTINGDLNIVLTELNTITTKTSGDAIYAINDDNAYKLNFSGAGQLKIGSNSSSSSYSQGNGINGGEVILSSTGTIQLYTSVDNYAIKCSSLSVTNGTNQITTYGVGIYSTGKVEFEKGTNSINADDEGIIASGDVIVYDGSLDIEADGVGITCASCSILGGTTSINEASVTDAIKANGNVVVGNGSTAPTLTITKSANGIVAGGTTTFKKATVAVTSTTSNIKTSGAFTANDSTITLTNSGTSGCGIEGNVDLTFSNTTLTSTGGAYGFYQPSNLSLTASTLTLTAGTNAIDTTNITSSFSPASVYVIAYGDSSSSVSTAKLAKSNLGGKKYEKILPATGLTISGSDSIVVGKTATYTAVLATADSSITAPASSVTWSIVDKSASTTNYATVVSSTGVVTAVAAGTSTLTASSDGFTKTKDITISKSTSTAKTYTVSDQDKYTYFNIVDGTPSTNYFGAKFTSNVNTAQSLFSLVYTKSELSYIKKGSSGTSTTSSEYGTGTTYLQCVDATTETSPISDEIKNKMKSTLATHMASKKYTSCTTADYYLDITLWKQVVDNNGTTVTAKKQIETTSNGSTDYLTSNAKTINVSIDLTNYPQLQGHVKYFVCRYHNGSYDVLTCYYNKDTKILNFETDKFSYYSLGYTDDASAASSSSTVSGGTVTDNGTSTGTVKTSDFDTMLVYFILIGLAFAGLITAGIIGFGKKQDMDN